MSETTYEASLPNVVNVVFERAEEMDGWWIAYSPEMPGVITQGEDLADTISMFKEAYELTSEEEG
jgi:predicted RNase H-like HicB family nuclease